ncbi:MerR family transcriptional regulator [Paraburkholderia sp. D15]|uniref:MerR family transcriptional regulator n=1 Tax=Paraburkholderia sp. D15 TaxID=2880218 RepID=UPI00247A1AF0|nr:MerR family transcriptional regulator [Paraburkholderia sp. D15]WGS52383.1 MerR family transcriptional regulator [Paraburkholderia sp. D15]WKF62214.1 HTH-type transcriptional repressor CarH [Paraburkholderia busanensis]
MTTSDDPIPIQQGYKSGEAARLAKMPVTTLRIWERRYGVIGPAKTASGQRLYTEDDVRRLTLIKLLVSRGHAIGAIARLDREQLQFLAARNNRDGDGSADFGIGEIDLTLGLVGGTLAQRLQGSGLDVRRYGVKALAAFANLPEAASHAADQDEPVDALLVDVDSLQEDVAAQIIALGDALRAKAIAVVYGFGTGPAAELLRVAGVRLYREPDGRTEFRQMLGDLCERVRIQERTGDDAVWSRVRRRYDDNELEAIASRSSTIACECPRHLAELVMKLSAFERYSDACTSRSVQDAALHRYLGDVTNRACAMVEAALERVAREEGWFAAPPPLPPVRSSAHEASHDSRHDVRHDPRHDPRHESAHQGQHGSAHEPSQPRQPQAPHAGDE